MISISHLTKSFNGTVVLEDINLDVAPGEIVTILGASGSGKSVLLRHIIGLLKPDQGTLTIDALDITRLPEKNLLKVRQKMGYLFQEGALFDFFNVFDNIAFPLREHTALNKGQIKEKVRHILSVVDLDGVEEKFPSELSGGMKKRVALARALILGSKILLCDEPTSGLDPIRSRDISDLIKNVSRKLECTTVITSHDIKNSFRISDRIALIHDKRFAAVGTAEALKASQDPVVRGFIEELMVNHGA